MPSSVGLGTLTMSGGAPRLSGTSSELDTAKLTDALVEAKRLPAIRLEQKITRNEAKAAAYDELKGLLQNLRSAVAGLRSPPGALGVQENVFERKEVYFSSSTATSPATLFGVSAANKAQPGEFEVVVDRLATARKFSGKPLSGQGDLATAANGGGAFSGSFNLGLVGGGSVPIDVDGTMTVHDLKAAINAQSSAAGVSANVIKVADADFRLVLTAAETGKEVALASAGGDDVLGILGLSADGGATFANSLSEPRTARVFIDDVEVIRSGNQITDAIEGLTFDLYKAEPGTTVTVEIERSLAGAKEQLRGLVDAYNAVRDFTAKQSALDANGKVAADAVLFGDTLLRGLSQSLGASVASPVAGLDAGALASLAGIGIRLDGSNRLTIDDATLDAKLLGDVDAVRNVLEFRFTSTSADLGVFARTNELADASFRIDIVDADSDGVPESATADGVALEVEGGTIKGRAGTAYAGLEMIWTGRGNDTIDVTATQGVADKLYNLIGQATDEFEGTLTRAADDVSQRNSDYRAEIEKIEARAERYREQLVERFGAMEAALSLAKAMLDQVRATVAAFSQER